MDIRPVKDFNPFLFFFFLARTRPRPRSPPPRRRFSPPTTARLPVRSSPPPWSSPSIAAVAGAAPGYLLFSRVAYGRACASASASDRRPPASQPRRLCRLRSPSPSSKIAVTVGRRRCCLKMKLGCRVQRPPPKPKPTSSPSGRCSVVVVVEANQSRWRRCLMI